MRNRYHRNSLSQGKRGTKMGKRIQTKDTESNKNRQTEVES